jgi:hypothetical protein
MTTGALNGLTGRHSRKLMKLIALPLSDAAASVVTRTGEISSVCQEASLSGGPAMFMHAAMSIMPDETNAFRSTLASH